MSVSNASASVSITTPSFESDLSVCEELLTRLFEKYAEVEAISKELPSVAGDLKSAYAKVLLDKCWSASRYAHKFNQEIQARIGDLESKTRDVYINTSTE